MSVPDRAGSAGQCRQYSEAKKVEVRLTRSNGTVCLSVSDDGVGCALDQLGRSGGLGVINMRERVLQLNGRFEFDSAPGRGTTVRVEVPFRPVMSLLPACATVIRGSSPLKLLILNQGRSCHPSLRTHNGPTTVVRARGAFQMLEEVGKVLHHTAAITATPPAAARC